MASLTIRSSFKTSSRGDSQMIVLTYLFEFIPFTIVISLEVGEELLKQISIDWTVQIIEYSNESLE
jgi:hypothetical protein